MSTQYPGPEEIVRPDYKLHVEKICYIGSWQHAYFSVSFHEPDYYSSKIVKNAFAILRKAIKSYRPAFIELSVDEYLAQYGRIDTSGFEWIISYEVLCYFEDWMQFTAPLQILMQQAAEYWIKRRDEERRFTQPVNQSSQVDIAFQTFGLSSIATLKDVRRRYRALAKQYHPDTGGDAEKFKQLNKANQVLMEHFQIYSPS